MNILFLHSSRHELTPWHDGSTRYRCYHIAEALRAQGHNADVLSLPEIEFKLLERYSVVSVLRPRPGKLLDKLLKYCKRLGIRTVADVDDLVFVPRYAALSPSVINQQATEISVRAQFKRNQNAMLCFDEVTVATEPLAVHWREQTGSNRVTVVSNGLSQRWLKVPVTSEAREQNGFRTITYLPGSNSHDKDFSEILEILSDTLNSFKDVKLLIVGSLNMDTGRFPPARLIRSQWLDYYSLPQMIANSSVTLAPLVSSPFTHAKSHIKFVESAAFGTPAVCSPNHDLCRHESPGLQIANTEEEWYQALRTTLESPLSSTILHTVKKYVRQTATADQSATNLIAHWKNVTPESLTSTTA